MAHFRHRNPENVPGKYYIDVLCLDCTVCREIAPTLFCRDDARNAAYVFRQPESAEEIALCDDCVARCPCQAIGDDGDLHDWAAEPPDLSYVPPSAEERENAPRWKFW